MPAHSACWPTTYGWTPFVTSSTPSSSRRSLAASSVSSRLPVTRSATRTTFSLPAACFAAVDASGLGSTPSTLAAAASTRSTAACSCAASPPLRWSTTPSVSLLAFSKRLICRSTLSDPLPGTSKPPPVRFSVCRDANGIEISSSTIQPMKTSFRRVRTNTDRRFIADCIRSLQIAERAEREHNLAVGACASHSCRVDNWTISPLIRPGDADTNARMEPTSVPSGDVAALPKPEFHDVPTSDGTAIRLTHYAMGSKGPIVLAPGYGNAARAFALDTVELSYAQYLGQNGYDVWLLDYRASPDLESSFTQFTVDDIAMRDWPAAIAHVRKETGEETVQAMGHCVGGLSLFMALGGGMEGVRSATFSALAGNPVPTPGNQLRARRPARNAVQGARDQGPEHRLPARLAARPRRRAA